MPDVARAVSGIPRADPGGRVTPRFRHRLIRFRHFCSGSLALASLDLACRNLVPAFPQRSPPRLLTTAACGGLRSAPDCRTPPARKGRAEAGQEDVNAQQHTAPAVPSRKANMDPVALRLGMLDGTPRLKAALKLVGEKS